MVSAFAPPPLDDELLELDEELELLDDELLDEELELLLEELEFDGVLPPSPPHATSADATRLVITICGLFMRVSNLKLGVTGIPVLSLRTDCDLFLLCDQSIAERSHCSQKPV